MMWSCESTRTPGCGGWGRTFTALHRSAPPFVTVQLALETYLAVRVRLVRVVGEEQDAGAAGREPAREHARGPGLAGGLGAHPLQPAAGGGHVGGGGAGA